MPQEFTLPGVGTINFDEIKSKYDQWLAAQHPGVEVLVVGMQSAMQGAFLGYLLGSVSNMDPAKLEAAAGSPQMASSMQALNSGGPLAQARNLAVMTGVNSALNLAIKKARQGKEDVWGA